MASFKEDGTRGRRPWPGDQGHTIGDEGTAFLLPREQMGAAPLWVSAPDPQLQPHEP